MKLKMSTVLPIRMHIDIHVCVYQYMKLGIPNIRYVYVYGYMHIHCCADSSMNGSLVKIIPHKARGWSRATIVGFFRHKFFRKSLNQRIFFFGIHDPDPLYPITSEPQAIHSLDVTPEKRCFSHPSGISLNLVCFPFA